MEYPKQIMSRPELIRMGFSRLTLDRAYHSKSNNFAWKKDPAKARSHIMFDTVEFEKWRQKEIKAQRGRG